MEATNIETLDWTSPKKRRSRKIEQEWSPGDVRLLIHLVQQRPLLWDPSQTIHKDGKAREQAFQMIAGTLYRSMADCRTKWDNLRAQYRNYQSRVSQNIEVKWQYFEPLSFLNSVCEPRKSKAPMVKYVGSSGSHFMDDQNTCSSLFSSSRTTEIKDRREPDPNSPQIFGDFIADQMRQLQPHIAAELKRNILKLVLEALEKQ